MSMFRNAIYNLICNGEAVGEVVYPDGEHAEINWSAPGGVVHFAGTGWRKQDEVFDRVMRETYPYLRSFAVYNEAIRRSTMADVLVSSVQCIWCGEPWVSNRYHPNCCDECGGPRASDQLP